MKVRIVNKSSHPCPSYATPQSAGVDLRANLESSVTIGPLERALVPTGLYIALRRAMRPRLGHAAALRQSTESPSSIPPAPLTRITGER